MADWSDLPKDLLDLIAKRLTSEIDILRFLSVCSSWRSSVSYPPPHRLPNCFPIHPNNSIEDLPGSSFFYLSRRIIFRIGLQENDGDGDDYFIKIEQDVAEKLHLLNPFSESPTDLPSTFPNPLNPFDFRICELGQEYILRYSTTPCEGYLGDVYWEKVVISSNSAWDWSTESDIVIMTIHISGKLAFFRLRGNTWTIIEDEREDDERCYQDDVIHYMGQFYAVDTSGRAVVVDPSLTMMTEIASPVFGDGVKKTLVESNGDLYMVDRHSIGPEDMPSFQATINWFRVFKLYKNGRSWIEVTNVGDDRTVFLGHNCSFSASTRHLSGYEGICIAYMQ